MASETQCDLGWDTTEINRIWFPLISCAKAGVVWTSATTVERWLRLCGWWPGDLRWCGHCLAQRVTMSSILAKVNTHTHTETIWNVKQAEVCINFDSPSSCCAGRWPPSGWHWVKSCHSSTASTISAERSDCVTYHVTCKSIFDIFVFDSQAKTAAWHKTSPMAPLPRILRRPGDPEA